MGINTAHFSRDGKLIVTASRDKTARVWDAETGQAITPPISQAGQPQSARFSPDGKWIATESNAMADAAAAFHRYGVRAAASPSQTMFENEGAVSFSPDGKRFLTISDKSAHIWDFQPASATTPGWLLRLAEAIAGQRLDKNGLFKSVREDQLRMLNDVRDELRNAIMDDDWITWGRWFLADRSKRTISPFSKTTVPEYIEQRIKENTQESLDDAEMLAIGNAQLLKRIAQAREACLTSREPNPIPP